MTSSVSFCTEEVSELGQFGGPASAAGRRRSLPSARILGTANDASLRRHDSPFARVRRHPVTDGVGVRVGVRTQERPPRISPKWPLSCENVVGDTGIEPVTSSVSVLRTAFTGVRSSALVQVSGSLGPGWTGANWFELDAVGVRVGLHPRVRAQCDSLDARALTPGRGHAESRFVLEEARRSDHGEEDVLRGVPSGRC